MEGKEVEGKEAEGKEVEGKEVEEVVSEGKEVEEAKMQTHIGDGGRLGDGSHLAVGSEEYTVLAPSSSAACQEEIRRRCDL